MELKYVSPNGQFIVASNLYPMNVLVLKSCKEWVQKQSIYVIFSRRLPNCSKYKTLHNFHITYPNGKNPRFSKGINIFYKKKKLEVSL